VVWGLQLVVGSGLVGLGIWARGKSEGAPEASLWWIPVFLGIVSLGISAVQRLRPDLEREALLGAFVAIGLLLVYMGVRTRWRRRRSRSTPRGG